MPQGGTNSTDTFQRLMNKVFKDLIHIVLEVYLDDIIVYSKILRGHVKFVQLMIERLIKAVFDLIKRRKNSIFFSRIADIY